MNTGMNKVILMGYVGNEPELRQAGQSLLMRVRLATNSRYRDRNDQYQERTDWHTVLVWGKRAEQLIQTLSKGDLVLVEGELRTDNYEKDGATRWVTEVRAQQLRVVSSRKQPPAAAPATAPQLPVQLPVASVVNAGPPPLPQRRRAPAAHMAAA